VARDFGVIRRFAVEQLWMETLHDVPEGRKRAAAFNIHSLVTVETSSSFPKKYLDTANR
jgi:hypothetical protein